ncbi:serine protease [Luteolibacter sp. Populi]|uniref:S1 family peptidase n=1 Tax=Luteolibacter sp. Populi TaxID=3230487 RepID=UPI003467E2DC
MKSFADLFRSFRRRSRLWRCAGGFAAAALLGGCGTVELTGSTLHRIDKALESRKKPSLKAWEQDSDDRRLHLKLAELQTGLLLKWDAIKISSTQTKRDAVTWTVSMKGKQGSISSAVPLTRDGYFLTASHCVEKSPMTLVIATRDRKMTKKPVRVVWRGNPDQKGPDLALIHADLEPLLPFGAADVAGLAPGQEVAVTGWSGLSEGTPNGGTAAGSILSVSPLRHDPTGAAWRIVRHDVPLNSGDSGGPLFTPDGRCAGINARVVVGPAGLFGTKFGLAGKPDRPLAGYSGEAVAPDPEWLHGLIAADRAAHKGGR